jgi:hypothetical protein
MTPILHLGHFQFDLHYYLSAWVPTLIPLPKKLLQQKGMTSRDTIQDQGQQKKSCTETVQLT